MKIGLKRSSIASADQASFRIEFGKFRGKSDRSLEPVVWTLGDDGWSVEQDEDSLQDRIVTAIEWLRFTSQSEAARALNVDKSTVSRAMQKLHASGRYTKDGAITKFGQAKELRANPELTIEDSEVVAESDDEDDF